MKVSLLNNSSDQYYWEKNFYEINNQIADAFIAAVKEQQQPSEPGNPFTDVPTADYYHDAVLWAREKGITTGTTATTFSPETTGTNYYDEPVAWANTKQLLDGTAVPFAPANLFPRADIVTYLYRDFAE